MIEVMVRLLGAGLAVIVAAVYGSYALLRPLPALQPTVLPVSSYAAQTVQLKWPSYAAGAVGAVGYGVLETHGSDAPLPTASTIKILTALLVLNQKPLQINEQGPLITITQADVDSYNKYVTQDGSVVRVTLGERISEYQALEALLIPSANNMAETLARWTFGSLDAFNRYASEYAIKVGLNYTTVTDPSGFKPTTVSSPTDLVRLGMLALANPVIAEIINEPAATLPIQGTVYNYNFLLGQHGIVGIKTGNNDQDKGCFLFAAKRLVQHTPVTVVGVLMDGPDLGTVIRDSVPLLQSVDSGFVNFTTVTHDAHVLRYDAAWSVPVYATPSQTQTMLIWRNSDTTTQVTAHTEHVPTKHGTITGWVTIHNSKYEQDTRLPLILQQDLPEPNILWRLIHPF